MSTEGVAAVFARLLDLACSDEHVELPPETTRALAAGVAEMLEHGVGGRPEDPRDGLDACCEMCTAAVDTVDLLWIGCSDRRRFLGWWYGYPACCVDWFCDSDEWPGGRHPERGHLLCPACRVTPTPLPDRPADRWRLGLIDPITAPETGT